ncbi:uncharacterized protein LOC106478560 [Limulus polyphemus]|uniref:Uncharacterized protein LOC106478560 n=1 Tax=Limulus polyphemus TaxID=6850 RepID=A0ABM1S2M1_LIMPO|nr:uncharacterized protein LOC106478560 [Limulus polyphemus]XP_022237876.1 uncharacterized protein LOC106478560 [Limulus polyphemus]XP_022237877.1 uncharacterized protein LOC106478560 [Limulus polyphemus]XP_022237879.1 uncharacterized protein LOC106478560 [Limulus polyphemus]XP_022237880.1 uncharacterized protein LOC106478560 [Limulus polyphemus]XP_022237881.1 uncharacterized protein LOC106478560 [Limulus polyphemus]
MFNNREGSQHVATKESPIYDSLNLTTKIMYGQKKPVENLSNHPETKIVYSSTEFLSKAETELSDELYSSMVYDSQDKQAVLKITEKYDTLGLKRLSKSLTSLSFSNSPGESEDSEISENHSVDTDLTEQDLSQIEMFFRGHKTYVYVCHSLANLYFTRAVSYGCPGEWELEKTGVPVLLFDKGDTRARNRRRLQIVVAEKGTGFVLWGDVIDNLTNYKAQEDCFHTLCLSNDHRQMAGLSFDNPAAAVQFLDEIDRLTSDPLNISLSVPKKMGKTRKTKPTKVKLPKKCDISQPCCFQHVTTVGMQDQEHFYTLATLVPQKYGQDM